MQAPILKAIIFNLNRASNCVGGSWSTLFACVNEESALVFATLGITYPFNAYHSYTSFNSC